MELKTKTCMAGPIFWKIFNVKAHKNKETEKKLNPILRSFNEGAATTFPNIFRFSFSPIPILFPFFFFLIV